CSRAGRGAAQEARDGLDLASGIRRRAREARRRRRERSNVNAASTSALRKVVFGPNGIRAGWRLVIFALVVVCLRLPSQRVLGTSMSVWSLEPKALLVGKGIGFAVVAGAAAVMSLIEKRPWGTYGLEPRRALSLDTLAGALWGFGC